MAKLRMMRTNETLLRALRNAASSRLTADELHEQRVSFIMGSLKRTSGVTRAQVESVLEEREGIKESDSV